MTIFVHVAEAGSFASAARRLGISPPAVTRAVAALEERLGARLLTRSTRAVRVTDTGARFLEDARRILADLDEAEGAALGTHAEARGRLHVTAPVLFGRLVVMPRILEYLDRHPAVTVRASFLDRVVNLLEDGIDVAVRIAELPDSGLTAVRVGRVRRVVCAAPDYLARHGVPATLADLASHRIIGASALAPDSEWRFAATTIPIAPRLLVNTNDGAIAAALAGAGLTRVLSYQVAAQVAAGELRIVLADHEAPAVPIHVVHLEGRRVSARVRTFVDLLVDRLRADPALA